MFARLVYDEYGCEQEFEFVYFLRWRLFICRIIFASVIVAAVTSSVTTDSAVAVVIVLALRADFF